MTSKTIVRMAVMFSFLIFISVFDTSVSKIYGQRCENTPQTNEAIVNYIYEKLKEDSKLAPQISHLNVTSVNLAVKIRGWVNNKSDYEKVRDYVFKTECVRVFNENEFYIGQPPDGLLPGGAGCVPGTKPCGDICIPNNDVCNIKGS